MRLTMRARYLRPTGVGWNSSTLHFGSHKSELRTPATPTPPGGPGESHSSWDSGSTSQAASAERTPIDHQQGFTNAPCFTCWTPQGRVAAVPLASLKGKSHLGHTYFHRSTAMQFTTLWTHGGDWLIQCFAFAEFAKQPVSTALIENSLLYFDELGSAGTFLKPDSKSSIFSNINLPFLSIPWIKFSSHRFLNLNSVWVSLTTLCIVCGKKSRSLLSGVLCFGSLCSSYSSFISL